ncbi:HER162Wp [Eremothecium sinecaudum]|uniref:Vacuolar protein sorting-associated protein 27 n=1 Tax=Eremothecium sinecaudum TaxID=45286 RepID=A0A0X8HU16_9SACH|nr:HER162Wp [Eremothecium sinecaudum]AMD21441.1 HER162Wp [Eremothecium sinecaudum]
MNVSSAAQTISELDDCIQRATNESIPNGEIDLSLALEVSDVIRSRRLAPKDCMRSLKKRIMQTRSNANTQLASWKLVEVCIKNGGTPFLKEVCSREFMDCLERTVLSEEIKDNSDLLQLCTRMVFELYTAFKNDSQLNYVVNVYERLQNQGVEFPTDSVNYLNISQAMFDSKTPAEWVDSDACMICSNSFSILNRKHHCRSCGGIFCQEHSSHKLPLPELGIPESVRVCDSCYDGHETRRHYSKKSRKRKQKKNAHHDNEDHEDNELRKAIELSLRESRNSDTVIPNVKSTKEATIKEEEEEDADLKAAIEASLKEHELEKQRRASQVDEVSHAGLPAAQYPTNQLNPSEEDDILLFATLVDKMKGQPASAVLENIQLQQLYQKVLGTRPRLNQALNDTYTKYNSLLDMNAKISEITTSYDAILERQLRNINFSQQYAIPQVPHDPYSYQTTNNRMESTTLEWAPIRQESPTRHVRVPSFVQENRGSSLHVNGLDEILIGPKTVIQPPTPLISEKPSDDPYRLQARNLPAAEPSEPSYVQSTSKHHNETKNNANITGFDFPTVPQQKIQVANDWQSNARDSDIAEKEEEQLLIEL